MAEEKPYNRNIKSTRWCFTIFTSMDETPKFDENNMNYLIYQREKCPKTEREHWQGYVRLKGRATLNALHKLIGIGGKFHAEIAKGTEAQAGPGYCSKEYTKIGESFEFGTYDPDAGRQGRRTDLEKVCKMITDGRNMKEIAVDHPVEFVKFGKGLEALKEIIKPDVPLERDIKVQVLWGKTNTGKSHRIEHAYPNAFKVLPGRGPFDKYEDEDIIFFEEFDWNLWSLQDMNRYLDKWRCPLNCRFRDKQARWTKVFIVSNIDPATWYDFNPLRSTLMRRITTTTEVISKEQEINLI